MGLTYHQQLCRLTHLGVAIFAIRISRSALPKIRFGGIFRARVPIAVAFAVAKACSYKANSAWDLNYHVKYCTKRRCVERRVLAHDESRTKRTAPLVSGGTASTQRGSPSAEDQEGNKKKRAISLPPTEIEVVSDGISKLADEPQDESKASSVLKELQHSRRSSLSSEDDAARGVFDMDEYFGGTGEEEQEEEHRRIEKGSAHLLKTSGLIHHCNPTSRDDDMCRLVGVVEGETSNKMNDRQHDGNMSRTSTCQSEEELVVDDDSELRDEEQSNMILADEGVSYIDEGRMAAAPIDHGISTAAF
ncbi:MAG: hypothetical protein ACREOZ_00250 [Gloeomargaritales cyanobacterium]